MTALREAAEKAVPPAEQTLGETFRFSNLLSRSGIFFIFSPFISLYYEKPQLDRDFFFFMDQTILHQNAK
jgi:hypothetical protein